MSCRSPLPADAAFCSECGAPQTQAQVDVGKSCSNCHAEVTSAAVFCPECGAYQGQPGVDHGTVRPPVAVAPVAVAPAPGLRTCPYCGSSVSPIARACTNCFRPLQPVAALSGPELKPASRGLVWFLMLGAVVIAVGYIVLEILIAILAPHTG